MRPAPVILAAVAAFAFTAPLAASDGISISQDFRAELGQEAFIQDLREDDIVNAENWLGMPAWWLPLQADAEWNVDIAQRFSIRLFPSLAWRETGGSFSEGTFAEREDQREDPEFALDRAEARLSFREWGLQALFGKTRPQFGANYLPPLSVTNLRGREGCEAGLWMGGLFWAIKDYCLETYCQTAEDPVVIAAASALFGLHEAGIVYRREYGNNFGAWYRGQIGDSFIPYAEFMLRQNGDFIDIVGLPSRGIGWNADALIGLGCSPDGLNASAYLEYRFRQAGYSSSDWETLRGLAPPDQALAAQSFPYLQSARHAIGLHLRNTDDIHGLFSWSASCVYLVPDGLFAEAEVRALLFDRLSLGANANCAALLGADGDSALSEIALWPYEWRFSVFVSWKINAIE